VKVKLDNSILGLLYDKENQTELPRKNAVSIFTANLLSIVILQHFYLVPMNLSMISDFLTI